MRGHSWTSWGVVTLVVTMLLSACSGNDSKPGSTKSASSSSASASSSPSPTEEPDYFPVPDNVSLTDPGTVMRFGQDAVVAWALEPVQPTPAEIGAVSLKVGPVKERRLDLLNAWRIKPLKDSRVYFAWFSVRNVGVGKLKGERLPVFGVDEKANLIPAQRFVEPFQQCANPPLPALKRGDKTTFCQVFVVPKVNGALIGVTFKTDASFVPILWRGEVTAIKPPKTQRPSGSATG